MKQSLRKGAKRVPKRQRSSRKSRSRKRSRGGRPSRHGSRPVLIALKSPRPTWKPDDRKREGCVAQAAHSPWRANASRPSSTTLGVSSRANSTRRSSSAGTENTRSRWKTDARRPRSTAREVTKPPLGVRGRKRESSVARGNVRSARRVNDGKRSGSQVKNVTKPSWRIDTRNRATPLVQRPIKPHSRATGDRRRGNSPAQGAGRPARAADYFKRLGYPRLTARSRTRSRKPRSRLRERNSSCTKGHKRFKEHSQPNKYLQTHKGTKAAQRAHENPGAERTDEGTTRHWAGAGQGQRKEHLLGRMTASDEKLLQRKVRCLLNSLEPQARRARPPPLPPPLSPHPLHRLRAGTVAASRRSSRGSTPSNYTPSRIYTPERALSAGATRTPRTVGLAGAVATAMPTPPPAATPLQPSNHLLHQARHICPVCNMTFPWLCHLKTHILTHDAKVYRCNKCNFMTVKPEALTEHKFTHIEQGPVKCNLCNSEFKSVRYLIRHINTDHGYPA